MPGFATSAGILDFAHLNTRSVDDSKVTDHHALITTGIAPEGLSEAEEGRLYADSRTYAGGVLALLREGADSYGMPSGQHGFPLEKLPCRQSGWRGIFRRKEDRQDDEPETDEGTAVFAEGDTVPVSGFGLAQKKTVPRPLYTEATLLAAMETCGREIADEQAREAVKELGHRHARYKSRHHHHTVQT